MEKGDFEILEQLIKSLQEASDTLDESYGKNDAQAFNKSKKIILKIQERIAEIL